ncbi:MULTISPECIES: hypothetical protein [unclassified Streptomyces]|uniref:hypothetical protein n=1 Tax=unclassified Streptomyces TaxID=2593676 RepID=UPI0029B7C84B|nr:MULTISPECIES: hypothetical protein [unclassified Streptomyces]MDX3772428.1 hypothetical protein [Streptomyces sp. AK08-01B]MDX3821935.1 hypothetical protein [Streptomyces sp. AK08-01A]
MLTLIVPCTCGRGYADIGVETESDPMEILLEHRLKAGQCLHDEKDLLDANITANPPLRPAGA